MRAASGILLGLVVSFSATQVNVSEASSICTKIQNQKEYHRNSERTWNTITEVLKYERYIESVLRNPQCVSTQDFVRAKEYVRDVLYHCPPRPGSMLDLFGKKTLTQMCSWAKKVQKSL